MNSIDSLLAIDQHVSEIIKEIYDNPDWKSYVDERLQFRQYTILEDENESLDQLIQWYINKKSKRVRYAGTKLRKAFLTLPAIEQRKVGLALLTGSMSDTEWICKRLNYYKPSLNEDWIINWHPCYADAIEDCWNKYHGISCGKLMIQFLNEETVYKHIDELTDLELYFGLCRRFINAPWFKLDIEKLKNCTYINAYLYIMSKTSQGISIEEAKLLLYQWIAVLMVHDGKSQRKLTKENIFWSYRSMKYRVINAWGIDTALYYLLCMNHTNVVMDFLKWDDLICREFYNETEYGIDSEFDEEKFREVIIRNFPKDMNYLLNINTSYYEYISTPGQPYTKPRLYPGFESVGNDIPMYLHCCQPELKPTIYPETTIYRNITKEEYNEILNNNPNIRNMVETLNLSLIDKDSKK